VEEDAATTAQPLPAQLLAEVFQNQEHLITVEEEKMALAPAQPIKMTKTRQLPDNVVLLNDVGVAAKKIAIHPLQQRLAQKNRRAQNGKNNNHKNFIHWI
jgi:hypothetical protein